MTTKKKEEVEAEMTRKEFLNYCYFSMFLLCSMLGFLLVSIIQERKHRLLKTVLILIDSYFIAICFCALIGYRWKKISFIKRYIGDHLALACSFALFAIYHMLMILIAMFMPQKLHNRYNLEDNIFFSLLCVLTSILIGTVDAYYAVHIPCKMLMIAGKQQGISLDVPKKPEVQKSLFERLEKWIKYPKHVTVCYCILTLILSFFATVYNLYGSSNLKWYNFDSILTSAYIFMCLVTAVALYGLWNNDLWRLIPFIFVQEYLTHCILYYQFIQIALAVFYAYDQVVMPDYWDYGIQCASFILALLFCYINQFFGMYLPSNLYFKEKKKMEQFRKNIQVFSIKVDPKENEKL